MGMETFGDFDDGGWSPPPEFDDLSGGSYGDEGGTSRHTCTTRTWHVMGFDVRYTVGSHPQKGILLEGAGRTKKSGVHMMYNDT